MAWYSNFRSLNNKRREEEAKFTKAFFEKYAELTGNEFEHFQDWVSFVYYSKGDNSKPCDAFKVRMAGHTRLGQMIPKFYIRYDKDGFSIHDEPLFVDLDAAIKSTEYAVAKVLM